MPAAARPEPTQPDADLTLDALCDAALRALLTVGTQITNDLGTQDAPASEKAEPYERIARAVRRTILLVRHLATNPAPTQATPQALHRQRAREFVLRAVEDKIAEATTDSERIDSLRDELHERLEDPALDRDLLDRPLPEIARDISRDLGLHNSTGFRYTRRTPAEARALAARAAKPIDPAEHFDPEADHALKPGSVLNALLSRIPPDD